MRALLFVLLFIFSAALPTRGAATIDTRLTFFSLNVSPTAGTGPFGLTYEASVTTDDFEINNELAIAGSSNPFHHTALYVVSDPTSFEDFVLVIDVNVPVTNRNNNLLDDFYEYSQAVSAQTQGRYSSDGGGSGPMTVIWNRAASNDVGTVTFQMPALGLTMTHDFKLLEYRGEFTYTKSENVATGPVTMRRMGETNETIKGAITVTIANANTLLLDEGTWHNELGQALAFTPAGPLLRDERSYAEVIVFDDGYPTTFGQDYQVAVLILEDPSDRNGNGIPDLTDPNTGGGPGGPAPRLTVRLLANSVELEIAGTAGASYDLEFRSSLTSGTWTKQQTITMPQATHKVTIARPAATRFWRLRVL